MIKRRGFIALLGGAAASSVVCPLVARAQGADRVRRVGIVTPYAKGDLENEARVQAFKQELEKLGWRKGGNVQLDEHWTTDDMDAVRDHAASLIASNPDVVVAIGGRVVPVLMRLSSSVPIVLPGGSDPVGVGWARSLAQPGGNVTGFTAFELSILGKSLELLKQIAPMIVRVALIYNPDNPNSVFYRRSLEAASGPLAIEPVAMPIHGLADIERAVASVADGHNGGIFFVPDITTNALRHEVVGLAAGRRVPAMYSEAYFVKLGGLASYGPDRIDLYRRAAGYVDRILRGEKAGDLPFQQPTEYEFMLNLKAAKGLDLELSPTLLALADEVIE